MTGSRTGLWRRIASPSRPLLPRSPTPSPTRPRFVRPKRQRLPHVDAASVATGALTAWQGLLERAQLQAGERVLGHGGSGSVGAFAVQLARHRGSHVIATASAGNIDFVKGLG